jgi:hypothetical protein
MFASLFGAPLLAHQGGWDEILLVVIPIALIAGLLVLAKKRVDAIAAETKGEPAKRQH